MSKTVVIPLPDRDFDTTEVAVPWKLLTGAGHRVVFATEGGDKKPESISAFSPACCSVSSEPRSSPSASTRR